MTIGLREVNDLMIMDATRRVMKSEHGPLPGAAWFAGAKVGLTRSPHRTNSWNWESFLYDIREMLSELVHMDAAEPGTAPQISDGVEGSKYDVLGGYTSVSAWMTGQGLSIPVPSHHAADVASILSGVKMFVRPDVIVIPPSSLEIFSNLVPLRGPILQEIEEVAL